ncbi:amino acid ABC transporter permease [Vulcanibacillus modesticaldus]|uniref:Amino acid ABC transporter permease n=1 Tax=Vulcanibacillus modesticaldus TaxID=337097 RepID=A0A1D2YUV2_9BACI|nr:amino acid ABC transporter permease [Vulcanibacillus modesticaldus]OEF99492.1 amino acid ABC transporter permease [Vulcanibacillus modesticaldus]
MEGFIENLNVVLEYKELFIRGFFNTILLTSSGVLFGLILGLFLGLGKLSEKALLRIPAKIYVDIFRGTPLFVQILLIHFALIPTIFEGIGKTVPGPLVSGIVALSLNSGAYIAEIFRAGIQSIDRGQMEAARSLGMTYKQAMRNVIIPQAFKRMLPPLGNEFIALLKDSSLLAIIAVNELAYAGFITAKSTFIRWGPYTTVALLYFVLTMVFSQLVTYLERRFSTE